MLTFSLVASLISSSNRYEVDDIFYSQYSLDGNIWTYFSNNGQMTNGLPSSNLIVTQNGLKGSTIQIRVTMDVDQDNERFKLDDIKVTVFMIQNKSLIWRSIGGDLSKYGFR